MTLTNACADLDGLKRMTHHGNEHVDKDNGDEDLEYGEHDHAHPVYHHRWGLALVCTVSYIANISNEFLSHDISEVSIAHA